MLISVFMSFCPIVQSRRNSLRNQATNNVCTVLGTCLNQECLLFLPSYDFSVEQMEQTSPMSLPSRTHLDSQAMHYSSNQLFII